MAVLRRDLIFISSAPPHPPRDPPTLAAVSSPVRFAVSSVQRIVVSFHPKTLPPMLRHNYAKEFIAWWFLPLMLAVVEGGVIAVIVKNTYGALPGMDPRELNFVVAALTAAPAAANITSFLWSALSHGRRKVRFITGLQLACVAMILLMALAPQTYVGMYLLAAAVYGTRIFWTGVITIRTIVWRNNYPRADRARIAGKLAAVQSIMLTGFGSLLGFAMDWDPRAFHYLYAAAGLLSLIGVWIYASVRLRGQQRLTRMERAGGVTERPSFSPAAVLRVLRDDPLYRRFMRCMFIFGLGNMMITAPLAIIVKEQFGMGNFAGILINSSIPAGCMLISIPLWARLLDRRHVVGFRAVHSWSFVAASALILFACGLGQAWLLYPASVALGLSFGGGVLAWNLGHHDFAPAHRASQYMGVHVTLTGVRGLMAPFLGVGLYELLNGYQPGLGNWVFVFTLLLNVTGAIGFVRLNAYVNREGLGKPNEG